MLPLPPKFTQINLQQGKPSLIYLDKHYVDFFNTTKKMAFFATQPSPHHFITA